jgi:hypothetical protein
MLEADKRIFAFFKRRILLNGGIFLYFEQNILLL